MMGVQRIEKVSWLVLMLATIAGTVTVPLLLLLLLLAQLSRKQSANRNYLI